MGEGLELRPVNVLIGANGTGKSNLVAFFSLLNHITTDNLSEWIAHHGICMTNSTTVRRSHISSR